VHLSGQKPTLRLPCILRHSEDKPTIGLLLCKGKNKVIAEYALQGINQPLGVSEYQLTEALPKDLEDNLPTIEKLEAALLEAEMNGDSSLTATLVVKKGKDQD
jgi:hypothetical protein